MVPVPVPPAVAVVIVVLSLMVMAITLVVVMTVVGVVQTGRLSIFMVDPTQAWGSAFPPVKEGVGHMCLSAYVHAAELAAWTMLTNMLMNLDEVVTK